MRNILSLILLHIVLVCCFSVPLSAQAGSMLTLEERGLKYTGAEERFTTKKSRLVHKDDYI